MCSMRQIHLHVMTVQKEQKKKKNPLNVDNFHAKVFVCNFISPVTFIFNCGTINVKF